MTQQPNPTPPPVPRWLKIVATAIGGVFVLVVLLIIVANATAPPGSAVDASLPSPTAAPTPSTIASSAEGIVSVIPFEDALIVAAQIDGAASDPDYVFRVGFMVESMAAAIQAGAADADADAVELDLNVSAAATDRLGNPRTIHVMTLTLSMADLRAARLDNLSVGRVLNLTRDIRFGAHGAQQLAAYCTSERGLRQSQAFCALAESKVS